MIDVFDLLQDSSAAGQYVSVLWKCDERNPRVEELGEKFREDYAFPIHIIQTTK